MTFPHLHKRSSKDDRIRTCTSHSAGFLIWDFSWGGGSDVHAALFDGKVAFASWLYQVNDLCVNVMYAEEGEQRQGLDHVWHPRSVAKRLLFKKFGN